MNIAEKIDRLYNLKTQRRAGWINLIRQDHDPRIESVAEHTYGAYLLAFLCLDDNSAEYDKAKVLQLLFIHDWAEAVIGDFAHDDRTVWKPAAYQEEEANEMQQLCPELYDSWRAMENGDNLNGLLAKDFDRLDLLVQLYRYRKDIKVPAEFVNFENNACGKLRTELVRNLWHQLKPYFQAKYA